MFTRVPWGTLLASFAALVAPALGDEPPVSFSRQVLPILQKRCQGCHQPAKASGKLDLTSFAGLKTGGGSGSGFAAGKAAESRLVESVSGPKPEMPPNAAPLLPAEVALITQWVNQGGPDDTPAAAIDTIDAGHPPTYRAPPVTTVLAFAPDGKSLAISGYREVLIHAADGSGLIRRLVGQAQRIEGLAFSPDGTTLAAVGGSPGRFGEVQFWDFATGKLRLAIRSTYDTLYGGAFTPDGAKFAFGAADNAARLVDTKTGRELLKVDAHSDWVFGTAFSNDGKHLITLGRDGAIKLVETATGSFVDDIGKNYGELKVLARHPKEDQVAIGGDERIPRLYKIYRSQARDPNYTDFNLLRAFETQPGPIAALAFAPDGSKLAVGGSGGDVRIYRVNDGARLATLPGHRGGIYALAFTPDGTRIATGGFDGTVKIFSVADGKPVASFLPVPIAPVLGQK
jgi:WD40 repeat protein/mono/diheme cytochrome c family protein